MVKQLCRLSIIVISNLTTSITTNCCKVKLTYDTHELGYLYLVTLTPTTIIKPERLVYRGFYVYQYNKIVYGAMTNEEAFKCLKALVSSALDGLHKLGLSHNDVS